MNGCTHRDSEAICRDLLTVFRHPIYADMKPIHAYRWLRYNRGEWV